MSDTDLPSGYRWATEHEMDRPDAIVVQRTVDSTGRPYTEGEADLAVPVDGDVRVSDTPHNGYLRITVYDEDLVVHRSDVRVLVALLQRALDEPS